MKKYEGITLLIYRPWDLEKFETRPARPEGYKIRVGGGGNRGKRKDMKHVKTLKYIFFSIL